jgi:anti-sigma factor RsiW
MNITRDVIRDLLPAYWNGEVSTDTRKLIEEFLSQDPEFASAVERERAAAEGVLKSLAARAQNGPPPAAQVRSLERTRKMLRIRSFVLAFAIFFSMSPMTTYFGGGEVKWLMFRDAPQLAMACIGVAAVLWTAYVVLRVRLRSTGL